jgi:hypothetical protein
VRVVKCHIVVFRAMILCSVLHDVVIQKTRIFSLAVWRIKFPFGTEIFAEDVLTAAAATSVSV